MIVFYIFLGFLLFMVGAFQVSLLTMWYLGVQKVVALPLWQLYSPALAPFALVVAIVAILLVLVILALIFRLIGKLIRVNPN